LDAPRAAALRQAPAVELDETDKVMVGVVVGVAALLVLLAVLAGVGVYVHRSHA